MNLNSSFKQKIAVLIVAGTMAVGAVQPAHAIFVTACGALYRAFKRSKWL